jgi:uncharacterized protein (TIGR03437 family)
MKRKQLSHVLLLAACASAFGDTIVVPNAQTAAPGNAPLRIGAGAVHLQEIVGSGQFPAGPITITGLRLRSAPGTGPVSQSGGSVQLTLSTTQAYPNTANGHALPSPTYANNFGPDAAVVFKGTGSLSSPGCPPPGPCPFDLAIPFSTPFTYDPNKGRFLIDIVSTESTGTVTGSLDGVSFSDANSSSVAVLGADPNQSSGTLTLGGFVIELQTAGSGPAPSISGVINAADASTRLCPGVLGSVFGSNFGTGPASSVSVTVGGKSASVLTVTPNQLLIQMPVDAAVGATTITAKVNGATSAALNVTLDNYAPAFFTADGSAEGVGRILTSTSARVTPAAPANSGDTLSAFAVGLGATTPATPTGGAGPNPTAIAPSLTVGGVPAQVLFAGISVNPGLYQINFKVPPNVQGTVPMVLSIGGKSTLAKVTLPLSGITSVLSNAGFGSSGVVSPGSIVSISANGIGTADQTTGFPSTVFQGYSVLFNGKPAPLFHLVGTANQIDLLVPYELLSSGTVNVQLKTPTGTLPNFAVNMAPVTPGLYTLADPSNKARVTVIAQFNGTAWLAMPDSMAAALKISGNCAASNISPLAICGQPASAGDFLVMYATGLGKATPGGDPNGAALKTGDLPPANGSILYKTVESPVVTVGGLPATLVYSGLAPGFPGLYQVDFQVPAGIAGDDIPVVLSIGGKSDSRTIAIRSK